MRRVPRRRSGVHAVDDTDRVWCRILLRDVRLERCLQCRHLIEIRERDGSVFVSCRSDSSATGATNT
jgi:hypothetical protein